MASQYAQLAGLAHNGSRYVVTGNGGTGVWTSDNGTDWNAVTADVGSLTVLGTVNGRFIGTSTPWSEQQSIVVSDDGVSWTVVHAVPDPIRVGSMAMEQWTP